MPSPAAKQRSAFLDPGQRLDSSLISTAHALNKLFDGRLTATRCALDSLRQIIGEEPRLLHGDQVREPGLPLLDQLQSLAAASLGTREHPFRVHSSKGLVIAIDSHAAYGTWYK